MGVESGVDAGSGRDADGELMAIVLRDFITFPFNGGRGLRTNQLAGEINRSQLHKDVGMPTYGGTTTYDAGTDKIVAAISQLGEVIVPPLPSQLLMTMPTAIDRKGVALNMNAGGVDFPLRTLENGAVAARDLAPGCLHGILRSANRFIFTEALPPRPQDYELVVGWGNITDGSLDAAALAAAQSFGTNLATVPTAPPGAGRSGMLWMGVPTDARDLFQAFRQDDVRGEDKILSGPTFDSSVTNSVGGVAYKWYQVSLLYRFAGTVIRVQYADSY